jgi:hypothetical protein
MKPTRPAVNEANACVTAKDQLLAAETKEEFNGAERRMRPPLWRRTSTRG